MKLLGELALLACAIGWGLTFPVIDGALESASPLMLNAARFLLAALLLVRAGLSPNPRDLWRALPAGLLLGALLGGGYAFQTLGLTTIGPSRSAFLTAFYVLFTPAIDWAINGARPAPRVLLGTLVAFIGLALMTGARIDVMPGPGDWLTLGAAFFFAAQIVALGRVLPKHRGSALLFLQILFCGLLSLGASPLVETPRLVPSLRLILAIAFLGVVATVLLLWLQVYGQRHTTPTRAALLFASEPVWAALVSYAAGDRLTTHEVVGASLVLGGIVLATLTPPRGAGARLRARRWRRRGARARGGSSARP